LVVKIFSVGTLSIIVVLIGCGVPKWLVRRAAGRLPRVPVLALDPWRLLYTEPQPVLWIGIVLMLIRIQSRIRISILMLIHIPDAYPTPSFIHVGKSDKIFYLHLQQFQSTFYSWKGPQRHQKDVKLLYRCARKMLAIKMRHYATKLEEMVILVKPFRAMLGI
jgi:hypothetical protein